MTGFDATEALTPFRDEGGQGMGAILFDSARLRQADPDWFVPAYWEGKARPVGSGGRGAAWFVDAPFGAAVLRHYLRGGWMAMLSRDQHAWRGSGSSKIRSFAEFQLLRELIRRGLPVPRPFAAQYVRVGWRYRAAILLERIEGARSLAERAATAGHDAPWEETGRLIARFHRAGLDHADLNASNILFDTRGNGWVIDLDRSQLRIPATRWREGNLSRLRRSLLKLRGSRTEADVDVDFARLRKAYSNTWQRGC